MTCDTECSASCDVKPRKLFEPASTRGDQTVEAEYPLDGRRPGQSPRITRPLPHRKPIGDIRVWQSVPDSSLRSKKTLHRRDHLDSRRPSHFVGLTRETHLGLYNTKLVFLSIPRWKPQNVFPKSFESMVWGAHGKSPRTDAELWWRIVSTGNGGGSTVCFRRTGSPMKMLNASMILDGMVSIAMMSTIILSWRRQQQALTASPSR